MSASGGLWLSRYRTENKRKMNKYRWQVNCALRTVDPQDRGGEKYRRMAQQLAAVEKDMSVLTNHAFQIGYLMTSKWLKDETSLLWGRPGHLWVVTLTPIIPPDHHIQNCCTENPPTHSVTTLRTCNRPLSYSGVAIFCGPRGEKSQRPLLI